MPTFRVHTTILEPAMLPADAMSALETTIQDRGGSDIRIEEDSEGRTGFSYVLDAATGQHAMDAVSETTGAALAPFANVRWTITGFSDWPESPA